MLQIIPWIFQGVHPFLLPGNLALNRTPILTQNKVIMDVHLDFLRLSENWHKPLEYSLLSKTTALEFKYDSKLRLDSWDDDVAIYMKGITTIYTI